MATTTTTTTTTELRKEAARYNDPIVDRLIDQVEAFENVIAAATDLLDTDQDMSWESRSSIVNAIRSNRIAMMDVARRARSRMAALDDLAYLQSK